MKQFEAWLLKFNFKKAALLYIVIAVITALVCAVTIFTVFRDRIAFAYHYSQLSKAAEHADISLLKNQIDNLSASDADVVDILILNSDNNVIYSSNKSQFCNGALNLTPTQSGKNYLVDDNNSNILFKYVKSEKFMLNSVFTHDFGEIKEDFNNDNFYESGFSNKKVYMLSYIASKQNSDKIYIISNPTSVVDGAMTLKISATAAMFLFMIYWVLLALFVYQNALKSRLYPLLWGIIVLLTNIAGLFVYLIYRRGFQSCPNCGSCQSKENLYCIKCGNKLGKTCKYCGAEIENNYEYCPSCGIKNEKDI